MVNKSLLRLAIFSISTSLLLFFLLMQRSDASAQNSQPKIVIAGWTLIAEDCRMPDGLVDPGETVTLNIALQNTGGTNTSQQLVATLQASGGVNSPGASQDYGRLSAGGPPVSRSFSFTAAAQPLGTTITLTMQISDGGVNRGTASASIALGLLLLDADPGLCQTGFNPPRSPSQCILTHCVSTRRPPFPVGNYTVICDTDAPSRFTMLLTVRDTQSPTITCSTGVTANAANGVSTIVNYALPTATDNCQVSVNCSPPSGSTFPVGTTAVNCLASDNSGNTTACAFNVTVKDEFGQPIPPGPASSDQKAGSLLAFPVFTSNATSPQSQNTRLSITNTEPDRAIFVHLFFISDACSIADSFVCLTAGQTGSFLASDFDPGTTGYLIAVATDSAGCPANFNFLIGDEFVKFQTGHSANLGAEAFAVLPGWQACQSGANSATINFDGVSYSMAARVVAVDSIPSRADGNDTRLILNRLGGDLRVSAGLIGSLSGTIYDDLENANSYTANAACQLLTAAGGNRFDTIVPAGRTGWQKIYGQLDIGLFGAVINFNPNTRAVIKAFNQGRNLRKLSLTNSASITIPVSPPVC